VNHLILPAKLKLVAIVTIPFLMALLNSTNGLATRELEFERGSSLSFTVNTPADVGDTNVGDAVCDTDGNPGNGSQCTLRAAIQEVNAVAGTETISFDPNLNGATITLNSALPDLLSSVNIVGPGASLITIERSAAPGTPNFRILNIPSGLINVSISGLTLRNGKEDSDGGGIRNLGNLTITATNISGNSALSGGAIFSGEHSKLTVSNSEISGNRTIGGAGAGILGSGALTISDSTCIGVSRAGADPTGAVATSSRRSARPG